MTREFEGIEVTYPPEDICIYPEYKGKPYFGIKYKENGEEIVGYGTYKPEVLSQYLKDYFIPTTKNDLGVDCISRQAAIDCLDWSYPNELPITKIKNLPSVTPQEPRKGHWIMTSDYLTTAYGSIDYVKCSCCGEDSLEEGDYCPNCGADMREVEE